MFILIFNLLTQALASPLVVMIDPGHGGKDLGACHRNVKESQITMAVAQRLNERLASDRRFKPRLTRATDTFLTLNERTRSAHRHSAALFISVHVNSSPDSRARGAEFYFQNQLPPDEESMQLAYHENSKEEDPTGKTYDFVKQSNLSHELGAIVTDLLDGDRIWRSSQLSRALKRQWRGNKKSKTNSVRQAPFFVLSNLTIPSTLVELGFITNSDDFNQLTDPAAQDKMAEDLYRGLLEFKDSMDKHAAGT